MHDEKRREHRKRNNDRLSEGWRELEKSARARTREGGRQKKREKGQKEKKGDKNEKERESDTHGKGKNVGERREL